MGVFAYGTILLQSSLQQYATKHGLAWLQTSSSSSSARRRTFIPVPRAVSYLRAIAVCHNSTQRFVLEKIKNIFKWCLQLLIHLTILQTAPFPAGGELLFFWQIMKSHDLQSTITNFGSISYCNYYQLLFIVIATIINFDSIKASQKCRKLNIL